MLVIRMQRTGRKGHAQFRVVVQDSRRTPTSGKLVAALGHYNPHTKETVINKEKASFYLEHGAQPSERVARLLKSEGVKLPKWVETPDKKSGKTKNVEKRRSTRPASTEPTPEPVVAEEPVETTAESEVPVEVTIDPEATVDVAESVTDDATEAEKTDDPAVETAEVAPENDAVVEPESSEPAEPAGDIAETEIEATAPSEPIETATEPSADQADESSSETKDNSEKPKKT